MAPSLTIGDSSTMANPYEYLIKSLTANGKEHEYFDVCQINPQKYSKLPYSIRVLLESAVRNCDEFQVTRADVEKILDWHQNTAGEGSEVEIPFRPARVILQDFTGVPAVVDLAAMRDKVKELGGDPSKINPICPADLVIDHSVQVDYSGANDALKKNQDMEFERNKERFTFLKWGAKAFRNMLIVPPGSGIVHQVNLEYLARVVFNVPDPRGRNILYPDSVVGTDSHTTMINGLGVLGWGVGGIEAEAVMLGQTISMVLPQVVGYKLTGQLSPWATSTDLVLTITKHLRQIGVVGKFVEFFGPSLPQLSIADRATISNMCPEYGATCAYFPVDNTSLEYLTQTNRSLEQLDYIATYMKRVGLFRDFADQSEDPVFTEVFELDLTTVVPSVSGPKRPQDKVAVDDMKTEFSECLSGKVGFKGFGIKPEKVDASASVTYDGKEYSLKHGSVVIAAITSCTNTSNPSVMLAAGMLAKKASERGLTVPPYVKTSLSPGSGVVTHYLKSSGVLPYLEQMGFQVVGYGCMTCIGNSGPLPDEIVDAIEKNDLVVAGVLSGNRNFEGRVHPHTRANYLASPPLVVAYALAGTVLIDFNTEPIGHDANGEAVFLREIWPTRQEVRLVEQQYVVPSMFADCYGKIEQGSAGWVELDVPDTDLYPWDQLSTYIKAPPFFDGLAREILPRQPIRNAYALLNVGDSVTTDHISPAGSIARNSPAARFLTSKNLAPRDYNSYGARRGNDDVMARGTFANIRLVNKMLNGKTGPQTVHVPTGEEVDIYDAAQRYKQAGQPVIILSGKDYGCGSSRDWAAKGPMLLGVRAVIAESYERIHRSNLVGMGIIPLQYMPGENAATLGLTGLETFSIDLPVEPSPKQQISVQTGDGKCFSVVVRFDTEVELTYYKHGGILNYMIRQMF